MGAEAAAAVEHEGSSAAGGGNERLAPRGGGGGDGGGWDFIDIDPFGSCLPFLEAAVAGVGDGGVLAVAATDLTVLCGKRGGRQVR